MSIERTILMKHETMNIVTKLEVSVIWNKIVSYYPYQRIQPFHYLRIIVDSGNIDAYTQKG